MGKKKNLATSQVDLDGSHHQEYKQDKYGFGFYVAGKNDSAPTPPPPPHEKKAKPVAIKLPALEQPTKPTRGGGGGGRGTWRGRGRGRGQDPSSGEAAGGHDYGGMEDTGGDYQGDPGFRGKSYGWKPIWRGGASWRGGGNGRGGWRGGEQQVPEEGFRGSYRGRGRGYKQQSLVKNQRGDDDDDDDEDYGNESQRQGYIQRPFSKGKGHHQGRFDDAEDQQAENKDDWNKFAVNHRAQNFKEYRKKGGGEGKDQFNMMHAFNYGIEKAGMNGVDNQKIEQIMKQAGNNMSFFIKQEGKMKETETKIETFKKKIAQYKGNEKLWQKTCNDVNHRLNVYRKERNLARTWFHVDMDMFYAACEIRDRPELADKPVAVGDYQMIQTTNYVARKFGVRSAMPGFMGKKLCPNLIFVKSDKDKYKRISETEFKVILKRYDPFLESIGFDEANLDITEYLQKNELDMPEGRMFVAEKIRAAIKSEMKMTSSIGIACNKMLAKICSEQNKPDGFSYLAFDAVKVEEFMKPKKVRDIPGVGRVQEQMLIGLGINCVGDILSKAVELYLNFTETNFEFLVKAAMGISKCMHDEDTSYMQKKCISACKSFRSITRLDQFQEKLKGLAEQLGSKLTEAGQLGRTLSLEYRTDKFAHCMKSMTFTQYIGHKDDLLKYSLELLNSAWPMSDPIRTLALKLNNLRNRTAQDPETSLIEQGKENLQYFMGQKGRRKGLGGDAAAPGDSVNPEDSVCHQSINLNSSVNSAGLGKRREKEERYKKLIGQKDISNFFAKKPGADDHQQPPPQQQAPLIKNSDNAHKTLEPPNPDPESFEEEFQEEHSPLQRPKAKPPRRTPIIDDNGDEEIEEEEDEEDNNLDRYFEQQEDFFDQAEEEDIEDEDDSQASSLKEDADLVRMVPLEQGGARYEEPMSNKRQRTH